MNIACINVYNDAQFLPQCLRSVRNFDRIIVIDGAYKDFPHKNHLSTDGSIEIAAKFGAEVYVKDSAWKDEIEKRNSYLLGQEGDVYLVIDADEELIGDFLPTAEDHDIFIRRGSDDGFYIYRVFKHRLGLHYFGAHNALWIGPMLLNNLPHKNMSGCFLAHHTDKRDMARVLDKGEYLRKLAKKEHDFRKQYGL